MMIREFALSDLFDSTNGDTDLKKEDLAATGIPLVTSGCEHCGIAGLTEKQAKVISADTITVDMFGNAFYRDMPYKMVTHARVFALLPKFPINRQSGLYLTAILSFLPKLFSYNNMCSWQKIRDIQIPLPVRKKLVPDFDLLNTIICSCGGD